MGCKFEVGDRVRVREFNDMAEEYGVLRYGSIDPDQSGYVPAFVGSMREYCGESGTVTNVYKGKGYYEIRVDFDNKKNVIWNFAEYMFEFDTAYELPETTQLYGF